MRNNDYALCIGNSLASKPSKPLHVPCHASEQQDTGTLYSHCACGDGGRKVEKNVYMYLILQYANAVRERSFQFSNKFCTSGQRSETLPPRRHRHSKRGKGKRRLRTALQTALSIKRRKFTPHGYGAYGKPSTNTHTREHRNKLTWEGVRATAYRRRAGGK